MLGDQKQRMKILPIKITSKYPPYRPAAGPLPTHSLFMDDFLLKLRELQDMEARERESLQLEQTELLALREQYSLCTCYFTRLCSLTNLISQSALKTIHFANKLWNNGAYQLISN
jgi:hypothetical protein